MSACLAFLEDWNFCFYLTLKRFVPRDNIKEIKCLREKKPSPSHLRSDMLAYAWDLISTCSDLTNPLMRVNRRGFLLIQMIRPTHLTQGCGRDSALGSFVPKSCKHICKSEDKCWQAIRRLGLKGGKRPLIRGFKWLIRLYFSNSLIGWTTLRHSGRPGWTV